MIVGDVNTQNAIEYLFSIAPEGIVNPIANEINNLIASSTTALLTFSFFISFWTGIAGVEAIRGGLNRTYDVTETRNFWLRLLQNILFIIIGIIGVICLTVLILFAPNIGDLLSVYFPNFTSGITKFDMWSYPLGILLLCLILFSSHMFLPNIRLKAKALIPGVLFSVILWLIMAELFTFYLINFSQYAAIYGSLGGIIATMVFIYISAVIFMFGGELNQSINKNN